MAPTNGHTPAKVLSPSRMAHVVLRTNKYDQMREFYKKFLGGTASYENDFLSFITYDEEHHRIAIVNIPNIQDKQIESCGLEHVAFTFDSLKDLCTAYKQRKALGINPGWSVNHGPTTSIYYRDPDGNMLETQVDNFDDAAEATAWMMTPAFAENALGADFDPEELCRLVDSGADDATLKVRKDVGPRGPEAIPSIMAKMQSATVGA